jgi:hypothetical protein
MKKVLSLLIMAMFLISIVPAAFAEQDSGNQVANTPTPTRYVVGGDREDFVAQAEERRAELLEKRGDVVAKRTRDRLDVAAKREELLRRFQENKAEMREVVANAIAKRAEAIKRYRESRAELASAKEKLKGCQGRSDVTCTEERRKARQNSQKFLLSASDRALALLEKTKERIEKSTDLSDEEKALAIKQLEDRLQDMASARETVHQTTEAATKEEIKESAKMVREAWGKAHKEMKEKAARQAAGRIGGTLNKIEKLEVKLDRFVAKLKDKGYDTAPIEAMMEQFEAKIEEGKEAHALAMQKFQEGNANEATAHIREAHKSVKGAHRALKDVVRKIRKANQGQPVREGVEPETEAEEAAEEAAEAEEESEETEVEDEEETEESEEEEQEDTEETAE